MLRVRLDACDVVDDRVWFDGAPLSGVGVQVVGRNDAMSRGGTVRLWEYVDGRRIGQWVERDLGGPQDVIVDAEALDQAQGDPAFEYGIEDFYTLDDQDFTGVVAVFAGPYLWGLEEMLNGHTYSYRSVYWTPDGALADYQNWDVVSYGDHALWVQEVLSWGLVPLHGGLAANAVERLELRFAVGRQDQRSLRDFRPYVTGDDRAMRSGLVRQLDESGRLCYISHLGDASHFEVASQVGPLVALRGDHLLSLIDVARLEVASSINIDVGDGLLTQIIEALGGAAAFADVTHLRLAPRDLSRETVEWFAALPNLESIEHASMDPGLVEEVFGELRPDVVVTRGGRRVSGG